MCAIILSTCTEVQIKVGEGEVVGQMKSSSCVLNLCVLNWLYKYIEISWISKYIEDVAQRTSDNSKYQIWLIRYQKCENKRGCLLRAFMLKKILREIFSILLDFFKKFFCNKKCLGYWQFLTKKISVPSPGYPG